MNERVYIGGLMRCCTGTLNRLRANPPEPPTEGQVIECDHCDSSMIWRGDGWHWNNE